MNRTRIVVLLVAVLGVSLVLGDCVSDPNSSACVNYQYPSANATADINSLCSMMSYMAVCSLQSACNAAGSSTGVCDPWAMLADSCTYDMPSMSGCKTFKSICATGSQVSACTSYAGSIPNLATTTILNQNVYNICESMSMEPCTSCPISSTTYPAYLKCDLLEVYSELCMQMPDMSECKQWSSFCASSSALSTSSISSVFCAQSTEKASPLMRMFFHTGILEYVLFESWVPRTSGQFAGYWFLCFFFAIIFECEKTLRSILEKKWDPNNPNNSNNESINLEASLLKSKILGGLYPPFSYRDVVRGFLHGLELTMSYLLMLVAMTFNVALFFAVIAGTIFGNIAVGRFRSYKPKVTCCD